MVTDGPLGPATTTTSGPGPERRRLRRPVPTGATLGNTSVSRGRPLAGPSRYHTQATMVGVVVISGLVFRDTPLLFLRPPSTP